MSHYWSVPPIWSGETCFILAGGPSLRAVPVAKLRDRGRIIVINNSYQIAPWADLLYFCDLPWWNLHSALIAQTYCGRCIVTLENSIPYVKRLRNTGELGLETDPSGLRHGSNSGYQAINLAYHLGVKKIVLLGYDMRIANGHTHWHGGHSHQSVPGVAQCLLVMLPKFNSLVDPLKDAKVEVLNASFGSALQCWPMVSVDDVLKQ